MVFHYIYFNINLLIHLFIIFLIYLIILFYINIIIIHLMLNNYIYFL